jgi:glycosyltransferase involved in cell wall biosynthesis
MSSKNAYLFSFGYMLYSQRHVLMLKSLKRQGWRVTVVSWDRKGDAPTPSGYEDVFDEWVWIRITAPVWSFKLLFKLPRYYFRLFEFLRGIAKPDLVILTHIFLLPLAFFCPGRKTYDAFEMYPIHLLQYCPALEPWVRPFWNLAEGLMVTRMDGVTTIDSRGGWLEKFYQRWNRRVQVIWNVPDKRDVPEEAGSENPAEVFPGRRVIVYTGGLMQEQGLRVGLKAAALVKLENPDVLFLFIGEMKDDPEEIQEMVSSLGIAANVAFPGFIAYKKLVPILRRAQAALAIIQPGGLNEYIAKGNSRKFFTYMESGIPIIAPNFGDISALIQEENCGIIVDPTIPEDVAGAVAHILDHPEEARAMGDRGRQAYLQKYNWSVEEQKFLDFVNWVTGENC